MFKIKLTAKAKRQLKNLSREQRLSVAEIFEEIKGDPLLGKPLERELTKKFSYRAGVYRIIYQVNQQDQILTILAADHRSRVYN